jgi:hypothetical protein
VISFDSARALRTSREPWDPAAGDRFTIDEPQLVGHIFWISDLTIEVHRYNDDTVLGFNGTTEWALDSVPLEIALWLPREDQLRDMLGTAFIALSRQGDTWVVTVRDESGLREFEAPEPEDAYAAAVLDVAARQPTGAARG